MKSDDIKSLMYLGLLAAGAYLAYQAYLWITKQALPAVTTAAATASSGVADVAQSIFGTGIAQPGQTYTVTMPDGSIQTVPYGQLPTPIAGLGKYKLRVRRAK